MNKHLKNFLFVVSCALLLAGCKNIMGQEEEKPVDNGGTPPAAATAPVVGVTSPLAFATGVSVNSNITAVFSAAMDEKTINATSFTVKAGSVGIEGVVSFKDRTATFNPTVDLLPNTAYIVTIVAGVKDTAGTAMAANKSWNFTTGLVPDTTPPVVSSTFPLNLQIDIAPNSNITALFSEPISGDTLSASSFTLMQGEKAVPGVLTYAGNTVTFDPSENLGNNLVYTATVTTGVKDLALNAMAANNVWSFTTGAVSDTLAPSVVSTIPLNLATGVSYKDDLTIAFSEIMNPVTLDSSSISLKKGDIIIAGSVTYSGVTAIFHPSENLEGNTLYTATVTSGAKDIAGNAMTAAKTWSFTTGTIPDTLAPTVVSTTPFNLGTNISYQGNITVEFSEPMSSASVSDLTFLLKKGSVPVAGVVTYAGVTATFNPSADLEGNTLYSATVTSDAKDSAGNAMLSAKTWSFTTGSLPDTLAPSVVSTTPVNLATGFAYKENIAITFSETMNPSTISVSTFSLKKGLTEVAGEVTYTGMTATFNPSADLEGNTVYTATVTSGVKDIAGNAMTAAKTWSFTTGSLIDTLAPFVVSTAPVNLATGFVYTNNIAITFSELMDPSTIGVSTISLKKGLTEVAGEVTYTGMIATFNPSADLEGDTVYTATVTSGAKDIAGNAMTAAKTWSFTTGSLLDTTAPSVVSTIPDNLATGFAYTDNISITFSELMDTSTISASTFSLKKGLIAVAGEVTYTGVTATFNPSADLEGNTVYTATVTVGAKDIAGNAMTAAKTWSFTTGMLPDTLAPTVVSTTPFNLGTNVSYLENLTAVFSEPMSSASVSDLTFLLKKGSVPVAGIVTYAGVTATFNPSADLEGNTLYSATVTSGAKDIAGNAMVSAKTWSFTTGSLPDTLAPSVVSTTPVNLATEFAYKENIAITFSETMNPSTINASTFSLKKGLTEVAGEVTYTGMTATFNPSADLEGNTVYTATVTTDAKDIAGNAMVSAKTWSFTTGSLPDTLAPTVTNSNPADNSFGIDLSQDVTVSFSEPMDSSTVNSMTFKLAKGATPIVGAVTYAGNAATFKPSANLERNTQYTVTVTTGAKDVAGNAMIANKSWSFTTIRGPVAVNLGTTSDFVILTEAGVDSIPTSDITGNIGVSPLAATYITHFSLTMDGTGTFSRSSQVTGKIYAADYATPTPAYLTTAIGDLQIADIDVSGRVNPDFLDLGTGDISGLTLEPGLYKWNSGVSMMSDVTLSGGPNDVWIFQVSGVLFMSADVKITLAGGAQAKNIFWKIDSGTINARAHLEGNVISNTAINFATGASINGRLLSHTAVNLDSCVVKMPK